MAYGKNKHRKDWSLRAMPLAIGACTGAKRDELARLQSRILDLMRRMAVQAFVPEPLVHEASAQAIETTLVGLQKAATGLNAVWAEQARMRVTPALANGVRAYFSRLAGSLRHVDTRIPADDAPVKTMDTLVGPPTPPRRFYHIPLAIQDDVTADELAFLKSVAESGGAIELFRRAVIAHDCSGLTPNQVKVLHYIHARAQSKYSVPDFGAKSAFTLQLHLDYRMLPTVKRKGQPDAASEARRLRAGAAYILRDDANRRYTRFLDIAGVEPRDPRIRIPVTLTPKIAKRIERCDPDWASLIVELTSTDHSGLQVGARLVCGKPPCQPDLSAVRAFVGRDFGYTNTIALSVALIDEPVDLAAYVAADEGKEAARKFFETHRAPEHARIVERVLFRGQNFLSAIERHSEAIDQIKSRIDLAYNDLFQLSIEIRKQAGLAHDARIEAEFKRGPCGDMVRAFFCLLGRIHDMKLVRRGLYKKIAAVKKNWFGMLSTAEARLAGKYHAVVVREDLDVVAEEKDSPGYKGRTFNKMLNNGSKGLYRRTASRKLHWNGIPEQAIPSWYTSRACTRHAVVVDRGHRRGESIFLPCCDRHAHADMHAGDTIALFALLQPIKLPRNGVVTTEPGVSSLGKHWPEGR